MLMQSPMLTVYEQLSDFSRVMCQKAILEGVGAVSRDGLPKGSRKTEDGAQLHYKELCEELRAVD